MNLLTGATLFSPGQICILAEVRLRTCNNYGVGKVNRLCNTTKKKAATVQPYYVENRAKC